MILYCSLRQSRKRGLKFLSQEPIDVVISDEVMPAMTGTDFLAVVRKDYPDTIRIILTGHANLESAMHAVMDTNGYHSL